MKADVVRIGMRRWWLGTMGAFGALFAIPMASVVLARLPYTDGFVFADGLALIGTLAFGAIAVMGIGLAIKGPVGLRIDAQGLSGFEASPPIAWADIEHVETIRYGRHLAIGIVLKDRESYWKTLSGWQRLKRGGLPKGMDAIVHTSRLAQSHEPVLRLIEDRVGVWDDVPGV